MNVNELRNDKLVEEWIDTLNPKPSTEIAYIQALKYYTDYTCMTPEELLNEAESEIKNGLLHRERSLKKHLIGFRKHLQESGLAPITVKSRMTGVRSFYKTFDIEIPSSINSGNGAKPLEKHKKIPDKEDIRQVLKTCGVRNRAIILVGCSSGLSANELVNLKVSDFKKGYDQETGITTLDLRRRKVGFDFITFTTPEASQAVLEYIDYRNRDTEDMPTVRKNQLIKKRINSDDDYLFIRETIPPEYLQSEDDNLRKLDPHGLMAVYKHISNNAGYNTPNGDWNLIRSHNMRKVFNTALLNAGCDSFTVEYLMGHSLDATRSAYFRASPDKLKEIYKKYIPYLTIQKTMDIVETPEYQTIKRENEDLRGKVVSYVFERDEYLKLQNEVEEMKKHQQDLTELLSLLKERPEVLMEAMKKQND